jgi:hypothetical protein
MRESRAIDLSARVATDLAVKPTNNEEEMTPEEYGLAVIVEAEAAAACENRNGKRYGSDLAT